MNFTEQDNESLIAELQSIQEKRHHRESLKKNIRELKLAIALAKKNKIAAAAAEVEDFLTALQYHTEECELKEKLAAPDSEYKKLQQSEFIPEGQAVKRLRIVLKQKHTDATTNKLRCKQEEDYAAAHTFKQEETKLGEWVTTLTTWSVSISLLFSLFVLCLFFVAYLLFLNSSATLCSSVLFAFNLLHVSLTTPFFSIFFLRYAVLRITRAHRGTGSG